MMKDDPLFEKAQKQAFRFLAVRARSTKELRSKLREKGYDETVIRRVMERLLALNYLDDEDFAQQWARHCAVNRLWGNRRIALSLREKGVSPDLIDMALNHVREEIKEEEAIEKIVEKKYGKKMISGLDFQALAFKEKRRLVQNLKGKGFPPGIIFDVLGRPREEYADDSE